MPPDRRTLVIVEDDPECREVIGDALEFHGYAVVSATNGLEALRYLETHPAPDVILLDLMMPVMDGWQFLQEQRQRPALAQIPVLLLSGERELARRAAELAVAGYLQKPVSLDDLLATVREFVGAPTEPSSAS